MATLTNKTIASTYTSLLKLEGDTGSTVDGDGSNAVQVKTGDNDATPLYLNTDRLGIGGQPRKTFEISGSGAEAELIYLTSTQSANTSNRIRQSHRLLTDSQERTSFSLLSGFNTIADGSRNSIVEFKTSNAGTFGTAMVINGSDVTIGDSTQPRLAAVSSLFDGALRLAHTGADGDIALFEMEGKKSGADADVCVMSFNNADSDDAYKRLAEIRVSRVGADNSGQFSFRTDNAGTFDTRMTITSAGNVGIGTSSPDTAKLEIHGGAYNTSLLIKGSGANSGIVFYDSGGVHDGTILAMNSAIGFVDAGGNEMIMADDASGSEQIRFGVTGTTRMIIDNSGAVGIGQDTPTAIRLHLQSGDGANSTNYVQIIKNMDSTNGQSMGLFIQSGNGSSDYPLRIKSRADSDLFSVKGDGTATFSGSSVHIGANSDKYVHAQNVPNHVANTMSSPYYRFDGVNDVITVTEATQTPHLELGTGDFSFEMLVRAEEWTSLTYLFGKFEDGNNYYALYTDSNDFLNFYAIDGGSAKIYLVATATGGLTDGQWANIVVVADRSGSGQFYVNGNAIGTTTSVMSTDAVEQNADFTFARLDTNYGELEMSHFKHFNKALTATEVKNLYSGASVPFKYKGANQTNLITNGTYDSNTTGWTAVRSTLASVSGGQSGNCLEITRSSGDEQFAYQNITTVIGKTYRLIAYVKDGSVTGGAFQIYAYGSSTDGEVTGTTTSSWVEHSFEFTATATSELIGLRKNNSSAGTMLFDTVSVVPIGAVAEYDGSGIASDKWLDKSGNDLHGTVSGSTVENAPSNDDGLVYEEGTYTITLGNGGTGATYATSTNIGSYTRIGGIVHVNARVISSENFSGSDGYLYMSLPFGHQANEFFRVIVYYNNLGTAGDLVMGVPATSSSGGTQLHFQYLTKNASPTTINSSALSSGDEISFQVTYRIA